MQKDRAVDNLCELCDDDSFCNAIMFLQDGMRIKVCKHYKFPKEGVRTRLEKMNGKTRVDTHHYVQQNY